MAGLAHTDRLGPRCQKDKKTSKSKRSEVDRSQNTRQKLKERAERPARQDPGLVSYWVTIPPLSRARFNHPPARSPCGVARATRPPSVSSTSLPSPTSTCEPAQDLPRTQTPNSSPTSRHALLMVGHWLLCHQSQCRSARAHTAAPPTKLRCGAHNWSCIKRHPEACVAVGPLSGGAHAPPPILERARPPAALECGVRGT